MFQFPRFAFLRYVFTQEYLPYGRWVSPFGNLRVKAYYQLTEAYRRLSRPSSPSNAKASIVCTYSLDHITLNYLFVLSQTYNL